MHNLDARHIPLSAYANDSLDFSIFQFIGNFYVFSSIDGMTVLHTTFSFMIVLIVLPLPFFQCIPQSVSG